ncbi:MAG: CidA/LrgA family protein [Pseudomonadota bacterium]
MINAILMLLGFQLGGEVLVRLLHLPVPGPVLGAGALAALLLVRGGVPEKIGTVSHTVLRNLSLLFVPAAVGVIEYREVFALYGLPLVATLIASTVLAMAAAALAFRFATRP